MFLSSARNTKRGRAVRKGVRARFGESVSPGLGLALGFVFGTLLMNSVWLGKLFLNEKHGGILCFKYDTQILK